MTDLPLKIGIIGAGNIGTAMAALLSQSSAKVHVAARGARLAAVRENGVRLDERGTIITAKVACDTVLPPQMDAVFVCVKSQTLMQAICSNAHAIGPTTLVIPMVNGIPFWFNAGPSGMGEVPYLDPAGELAKILMPAQILGAVLLITVRMDAEDCAVSSNTPTLSLGPAAPGTNTAHVARLVSVLNSGGVRTDISEDIRKKLLVKLLANLTTNPLTAYSGATLKDVALRDTLRSVAIKIADEFRAWAKIEGYELPDNTWLIDLLVDAGDFPTSMLQDARAGRPLEMDAICRAPLALAQQAGCDMPTLTGLLQLTDGAESLPLGEHVATENLRVLLAAAKSRERVLQ